MTHALELSASLLSADFSRLKDQVQTLDDLGVERFHLDVMDGHFVPNITFGAPVIKAIRPHTARPFDVHLMIKQADRYIESFVDAGADVIIIHPESEIHVHRTLEKIKKHGIKAGLALNPATSLHTLDYVMDLLDMVLIMTVNPGFGGQAFIESQLKKIEQLKQCAPQSLEIAVDGGINTMSAPKAYAAGARILVAGSAIFKGEEYAKNMEALRKSII